MDILKRKSNTDRTHNEFREIPIYTTEEADARGIRYKHWKEVTPDFLYTSTDDGFVVPIVYMRKYGGKWYIKTEIGPLFQELAKNFTWLERKESGNFCHLKPANWVDRELKSKRFKKAVRAYAEQIFNNEVDLAKIGKMIRPDVRNSAWVWRRYLKQKKVQEVVSQELEKLYEEAGVSKRTIVSLEQEAIQMARDSGRADWLLKVAQTMAKRLGMDEETKLITTDTVEMSNQIEDLEKKIIEAKKVKAARKIEYPKSEIIENAGQEDFSEES